MEQSKKKELQALAIRIRMAALDAVHSRGSGHLGGALSIADVLAALYGGEMKINPADPAWPERDKLVCSKGHAGCVPLSPQTKVGKSQSIVFLNGTCASFLPPV